MVYNPVIFINALVIQYFNAEDFTAISLILVFYLFIATTFFFGFQFIQSQHRSSSALLLAGMATLVGAIQYYFLQSLYFSQASLDVHLRYPGWLIIMPLLLGQFYLIVRPYGIKLDVFIRMVIYSVFMLIMGYLGTTVFEYTNISFGFLYASGFLGVIYEVWFGKAHTVLPNGSVFLRKAYNRIKWLVLVGWSIYFICYLNEAGNYLANFTIPKVLILNIADLINIVGWGLVVFMMLKEEQESEISSKKVSGRN